MEDGAPAPSQSSSSRFNDKLRHYPGIIFNYTQPAEDAVDEALTGLKSSLAVKVYGDDLNVLQDKAIQIKNALSKSSGLYRPHRCARARPA